jgi:hypothetical protein
MLAVQSNSSGTSGWCAVKKHAEATDARESISAIAAALDAAHLSKDFNFLTFVTSYLFI